jgi:hypothetical protein
MHTEFSAKNNKDDMVNIVYIWGRLTRGSTCQLGYEQYDWGVVF